MKEFKDLDRDEMKYIIRNLSQEVDVAQKHLNFLFRNIEQIKESMINAKPKNLKRLKKFHGTVQKEIKEQILYLEKINDNLNLWGPIYKEKKRIIHEEKYCKNHEHL